MAEDIERSIGRLEGQVERILDMMETSAAGRKQLYDGQERIRDELHQVRAEVATVGRRVEGVEAAVQKVEPVASEFTRLKERGLGIIALFGVIWLFFGGLAVKAIEAGIAWLMKALN